MGIQLRKVTVLHDGRDPAATDVVDALKKIGLEADELGVGEDLETLVAQLRHRRPDLVVNMVTRFAGNARLAPDVAAAIELAQLPMTGAGPAGLYLAADPALSRKLLQTHEIEVAEVDEPPGPDALVAVVGNERLEVQLAPVVPESDVTAAIDEERWSEQRELVGELARGVVEALRLRDYALLVVRMTPEGRPALVRALPNPPLGRDGDLARAFVRTGDRYEELVRRIVEEAWDRAEAERHPAPAVRG